ncbi:MAG: dihydrodipicolinate synthase family protein [Acuticoccus sp.]
MDNGVGLALFGTNSKRTRWPRPERKALLEAVVADGLSPGRMMPGTGACDLPTAIDLTAHAVGLGCAGVLMLPPFYYKGVSDDGLFDYFSRVIDGVADPRLRVYLYHIPPVAQVPISLDLIERLRAAYGDTVAGVKDSGGDFTHTKAMIDGFAADGFEVFAGSETFLLDTMRAGGAGCISATANVNPAAISALQREWQAADAEARQAALDTVRAAFQAHPMIPAMKAAVSRFSGDAAWASVRPPLVTLGEEQRGQLFAALDALGFKMAGLEETAGV